MQMRKAPGRPAGNRQGRPPRTRGEFVFPTHARGVCDDGVEGVGA